MTREQRAQLDMFPDSPEANAIRAAEAITLRCRIETLLRMVAVEIRPCRKCKATIYFVASISNGKHTTTPFDPDGQSHFKTCPYAADFSKRGAK